MSRKHSRKQVVAEAVHSNDPKSRRTELFIFIVLALLPLVVYSRVVTYEFVNYDDWEYVRDNPQVRSGLSVDNFVWAFTTFAAANYHPLTYLSLMLDGQLFHKADGELLGGGFHAVNLLFHVANTLLLFIAIRQLTGKQWRSAFVAALFAIHPQHVESVAWITERKDVLSLCFGFLTLLAYLKYVRQLSWKWYVASLALMLCSLLSKPTLVTFGFLLLLLDWWPLLRNQPPAGPAGRGISWTKLALEKLPYIFGAIVFSFVVIRAQGTAVAEVHQLSLGVRLGNAMVAYVLYLYHLIWPVNLVVIYPHPGTALPVWQAAGASVVLAAITATVFFFRRTRPYLFVGWFWFLGTMVPMIGIVQVGTQQMADRYSYFPLIGLYLALTWLAADFAVRRPALERVLVPAAAVILLLLAGLAWRQVGFWKNSETLFRHALDVASNNPVAHVNLAQALHVDAERDEDGNKLIEAIGHYRQALETDTLSPTAHKNLGKALAVKAQVTKTPAKKEELEAAVWHFRKGLELDSYDPSRDQIHFDIGNVLNDLGRLPEATAEYRQAVKLSPDYELAHLNLSRVLLKQNQFPQALNAALQAQRLQPQWQEAVNLVARVHREFGKALASQGQIEPAIEQFRLAVKTLPSSATGHFWLAKALAERGKTNEAVDEYNQAISRRSDFPEAHYEMGVLLLTSGKRDEGLAHLNQALRLKPDYADAKRALERANSGT